MILINLVHIKNIKNIKHPHKSGAFHLNNLNTWLLSYVQWRMPPKKKSTKKIIIPVTSD